MLGGPQLKARRDRRATMSIAKKRFAQNNECLKTRRGRLLIVLLALIMFMASLWIINTYQILKTIHADRSNNDDLEMSLMSHMFAYFSVKSEDIVPTTFKGTAMQQKNFEEGDGSEERNGEKKKKKKRRKDEKPVEESTNPFF